MKTSPSSTMFVARPNRSRRGLLIGALLSTVALPVIGLAQSPAWPTKPVRIITGWTPGGNADVISRMLADNIGKHVSQPIIVDNRPGAAGTIGAQAVVRAEPDGHTLLVATMVEVTVVPPASIQTMGYDPDKDLQPVTLIGKWPLVLVANPSFPANSMAELVAYAKAHPGKVNFGSLGNASINHLTGELLNITAGIDATHVPYKGGAPMMTDLIGGEIQFAFDSVGATLPLIRSGKVKALAVTDTQRAAALPDVPTTAEAGYPAVVTGVWMGLFAPAKTPKKVLDVVYDESIRVLNSPDVRKQLADRSIQPVGNTPEEFRQHIEAETKKKRDLAARIGIKAE